jgi:hypothetical protein
MQVRVNPRSRLIVDVLRDAMRLVPVALRIVPERDERLAEVARRRGVRQRRAKVVECHRRTTFTCSAAAPVF